MNKRKRSITDLRIKKETLTQLRKVNAVTNRFLKAQERFYKLHTAQLDLLKDRINQIEAKLFSAKRLADCFDEVKKTHQCVEDTILNVLLAIRQNEYLQAWYPPQNGYPEMKVVGSHPSKIEQGRLNGS